MRRSEFECAESEHAAATANVEDSLPAPDHFQQLLDEQACGRMLAVAEAPWAEFDQSRQVAAVVLDGPGKHTLNRPPKVIGADLAWPRLADGCRARVDSPATVPSAGEKDHRETLGLPVVIHAAEHESARIMGATTCSVCTPSWRRRAFTPATSVPRVATTTIPPQAFSLRRSCTVRRRARHRH